MKKIKKIMAMLVAMVMVLGMTVTASAAPEDNAKIIINNLDDQAKVKVTQVIAPNPKKETGWEFTNNALTAYQSQDAFNQMEEQKILKQLINYQALIENPQLQEANYI